MKHKFVSAAAQTDASLGPRQIRVRASNDTQDRVGDVLIPKGCVVRMGSVPVLLDHQAKIGSIVGRAAVTVTQTEVDALITFLPEGQSKEADDACAKYKGGFATDVSVGFDPIDYDMMKDGVLYKEWELLELSLVVAGCNPEAVVTGKSVKSDAAWKCGASLNLPIDESSEWDDAEAETSIFEKADFGGDDPDAGFARKGFLAYDSGGAVMKGSYRLPFAKVVDGRLTAFASGIRAAASRLPQTDISDAVALKARAVIDHYEARMREAEDAAKAARVARVKKSLLSKGLSSIAYLCEIAQCLGWAQIDADWEREIEGDDSKLPEMLAGIAQDIVAAIVAMTKEETDEFLAQLRGEEKSAGASIIKAMRISHRKGEAMGANIYQEAADAHKAAAGVHADLADLHEAAAKRHKAMRDGFEAAADAFRGNEGGGVPDGASSAHKSMQTAQDGLADAHADMRDKHKRLKTAHADIAKCFKGISDKIDAEGTGLDDTGKSWRAKRTRELEIMALGAEIA